MSELTGIQWTDHTFFGDKHWTELLKWNRASALDVALGSGLGRRHRVFCASMADVFEERPALDEHRLRLFDLIEQTPYLDWQLLTKRPEFARDWLGGFYGDLALPGDFAQPIEPFPNVWLGVSIENARHTWRANVLREIPAAVRFISAEPLLGSLYDGRSDDGARVVDRGEKLGRVAAADVRGRDGRGVAERGELQGRSVDALASSDGARRGDADADGGRLRRDSARVGRAPLNLEGIDWVIVGGESGPGARPMQLEWAREIVREAKRQECCGRWTTACCGCYLPTGECCGQGEQACCYEPDIVGPAVFVKQLGAKPVGADTFIERGYHPPPHDRPLKLRDRKGGDWDEWPADLRIREFPRTAAAA